MGIMRKETLVAYSKVPLQNLFAGAEGKREFSQGGRSPGRDSNLGSSGFCPLNRDL
jgi:hypothetical protein